MNDNIKAGADHHAGDGGYSEGTQEKYNEFVKGRNQSLGKVRIEKLIEQCTVQEFSDCTGGFETFDKEKFAELIVRECAEQIIAKGTDWVDFAPSQTGVRPEYWDIAQQIKEHFGVGE